ncbi:unnamed protein product [Trichobilharzia regenti]|nr:unnamed protein product [Trichobilharzia regenti]
MGDAYGAAIVEHLCRKEISDISNPSIQLHRGGLVIQLDQKDRRNVNKSNNDNNNMWDEQLNLLNSEINKGNGQIKN